MQTKSSSRIDVVDALRGFAVLAILIVHNIEHFIYGVYPTDTPHFLNVLDTGVMNSVFTLFGGKAYAIFALLFGFTFYLQSNNQKLLGKDFGYRFIWRLVLLTLFATFNALFFPGGDVLMLFAIVGLVLFIVRNWSDRAVLITAIIFTLQPIEWFHYIAYLTDASHQLPDYGVGELYGVVNEVTASGNFGDFLLCNATIGQKASFMWAVGAGRVMQTAGLFLIGFYLGRKEMFCIDGNKVKTWIKILAISAVCYAPLNSLQSLIMKGSALEQQTVGVIFDMWQKLSFTFVLVSAFVLLYQNERFQRVTHNLKFYGRMSMTNYITQSILGAVVYFPIGLNLAQYCGYTVSLGIALIMFVAQVWLCRWWLKNHKQGPFEGLWHKLTWLKF